MSELALIDYVDNSSNVSSSYFDFFERKLTTNSQAGRPQFESTEDPAASIELQIMDEETSEKLRQQYFA